MCTPGARHHPRERFAEWGHRSTWMAQARKVVFLTELSGLKTKYMLQNHSDEPAPKRGSAHPHHRRLHQLVGRRRSKAHQYLRLALDTYPGYRFVRLSNHMLSAGIIAGWNTNKSTAYKTNLELP